MLKAWESRSIKYKLLAFAMGAAVGCLGGAFFPAKLGVANPGCFTLLVSINVLAVVVLGGLGSIPGVVVGSAILVGLPELSASSVNTGSKLRSDPGRDHDPQTRWPHP